MKYFKNTFRGSKIDFLNPASRHYFSSHPASCRSKQNPDPVWLNPSSYISPCYFDRWTIYSLNNDKVPSLRRKAKTVLKAHLAGLKKNDSVFLGEFISLQNRRISGVRAIHERAREVRGQKKSWLGASRSFSGFARALVYRAGPSNPPVLQTSEVSEAIEAIDVDSVTITEIVVKRLAMWSTWTDHHCDLCLVKVIINSHQVLRVDHVTSENHVNFTSFGK